MRISDWSSDVCSSDLLGAEGLVILRIDARIARLFGDADVDAVRRWRQAAGSGLAPVEVREIRSFAALGHFAAVVVGPGQIALLFEQRIDAQHEGRCSEAVVAGEEHLRVRTDHLHQLLYIAIELFEKRTAERREGKEGV